MVPNFDVSNKVYVITGGAGVLGGEMCRQLSEAGANIAVVDLKVELAVELADEINENGGNAKGYACNVLDKDAIITAKNLILEDFGRVDVLINCAGGNHPKATANADMSFFDIPQEAMEFVMNLNYMGTLMPSQIFGKVMAEQGFGNIINISSMSAFTPLTKVIAYSNAKAAINNLTQWMATYFAENVDPAIRVNAIAPGFLLTNQNYYLLVDKDTGDSTPRGGHILQQTPMNRYGEPKELVGAIIFLSSDASSFITGTVIPIDGGFSAYAI